MDISSISTNYTVANANKSAEQSNSLQSSLKNISSDSSEEQLKGVIKDFESYFVEQVIKQMKDTFTSDDDEDSTMSQYKDLYMDQAIETVADEWWIRSESIFAEIIINSCLCLTHIFIFHTIYHANKIRSDKQDCEKQNFKYKQYNLSALLFLSSLFSSSIICHFFNPFAYCVYTAMRLHN